MTNWFPIRDYEGLYEVSSEGEIRNVRTKHILKPAINGAGYLTVSLSKEGDTHTFAVHVLVALHHVANKNPKKFVVVHHKDENRLNNNKDNLQWTTQKHNCEASAYQQAKTVTLIGPDGMLVEVTNVRKFARENNLNPSNLNRVTIGARKVCGGWRLTNE